MWCKNCNRETDEEVCSVCGIKTEEDIPYELHWCDECKVPLIKAINDADRDVMHFLMLQNRLSSSLRILTVNLQKPIWVIRLAAALNLIRRMNLKQIW